MRKTEMKAKSTRKPLTDVTNGTKSFKTSKKKSPETLEGDALDRLLLVHSDLSSLVHQIDELVAQALKVKVTSKMGRKEIESFTQVLSEIQSSLKPWAPRFQKAISSQLVVSDNQLDQSLMSGTVHPVNEDSSNVVQSPEDTQFESLISPSPLVSWRGECTIDGGRQLFLLTPLPRPKSFSSKFRGSSKSAMEKINFNTNIGLPSLMAISTDTNDDLLEGREIKATPAKVSDFVANERESDMESGVLSPPKFTQKDCSLLVFTPHLKMSPPKSCVLLEPISELPHRDNHGFRKSTPFPVGIQNLSGSETSEASSSGASENLALKYPEIFGIQPSHRLGNGRQRVESSPNWFMSPPKSCVLMEPSDEKQLTNATIKNCQLLQTTSIKDQQKHIPSLKRDYGKRDHQSTSKLNEQEFVGFSAPVESTPMLKEPEITFPTGKHPGENTLKKELWTKFEAASSHGIRFGISVIQRTAQKGFLDRLEEVCSDEPKSSA